MKILYSCWGIIDHPNESQNLPLLTRWILNSCVTMAQG